MASKFSALFNALAGSAAASAVVAPAASTPQPNASDVGDTLELTDADRADFNAELAAFGQGQQAAGHAAGFKAATDRFCAVMGSDAGKANPAAATKLLANEKLAALSAEEIIDTIPAAPAAAVAAPTPAAAATEAAGRLEATPSVALGNEAAANAGLETGERTEADALAGWGSIQGKSALTESGWGGIMQNGAAN